MFVAASMLAACGTGSSKADQAPGGEAGKTSAAARTAELTPAAVTRDIRRAVDAGGFARPQFAKLPPSDPTGHCVVNAKIRTADEPDQSAAEAVVAALKESGWRKTGGHSGDFGAFWYLQQGEWTLDVMTGVMTAEELAATQPDDPTADTAQGFAGLVLTGIDRKCAAVALKGSAEASPN
ncbi:hypothetical protein [Streptomyces fragilis]|uniref:Lipoprotein n=1 Tax=Streptomyces fragilis TaxID=67301 RepID=A0ABV2YKC2_9ACTN|nr:hypothetical protein [Streptomyces fragilis]